jgi:hypothetical protein
MSEDKAERIKKSDAKHDKGRKFLPRLPSSRIINAESAKSLVELYALSDTESKLDAIVSAAQFALANQVQYLAFKNNTTLKTTDKKESPKMPVITPSQYNREPMGSLSQNSESETIAKNIMHILSKNGDVFRPLSFEEYTDVRKSDGANDRHIANEKPYFDEVISYCASPESADLFCADWRNTD